MSDGGSDWREALFGGGLHDGAIRNLRIAADGSSVSMRVYNPDGDRSTRIVFRDVPSFAMRFVALLNIDIETESGKDRPAQPADFPDIYETHDCFLSGGTQPMIFLFAEEMVQGETPELLYPAHRLYHHVRIVAYKSWEILVTFRTAEVTESRGRGQGDKR